MDYRERTEGKLGVLFRVADQFLAGQIPQEEARELIGNELSNIRPGQLEAFKERFAERLKQSHNQSESEKLFALFRNYLAPPYQKLAEGHPLRNYYEENCRLRAALLKMDELEDSDSTTAEDWIDLYQMLQKYLPRMERQAQNFYPCLNTVELKEPLDRILELQQAIYNAITENLELLENGNHFNFLLRQRDLSRRFMSYLDLEEKLLYAKAREGMTGSEFETLRKLDDAAGYVLIEVPPLFVQEMKGQGEAPGKAPGEAPGAEQILAAITESMGLGLICYDLKGTVLSVRGQGIGEADLALSAAVQAALLAGTEWQTEKGKAPVEQTSEKTWRIRCSLIRDKLGKPSGFLKVKEPVRPILPSLGFDMPKMEMDEVRISLPVNETQNIAELFEQYPEFKEGFYALDPELSALKGPYGMALLKDSTIEMIAKSLRIDTEGLTKQINQLLQSYE